ncbi:hypothetical protein SEPCBS119000_000271 [Sporothrix epigloea]|uniref:GRF-type domain-containing protein n=1 Tax=Sporothrix epigloea TaxID=1892477 RepID=A0ABP0D5X8_9PEZI
MPRGRRRRNSRRSQPSTPRTARIINPPLTPSFGCGTDGLFFDGQWFCNCRPRRPAALRETRKPGINKGRWFFGCPQERGEQCSFFLWEDYSCVFSGVATGESPGFLSGLSRPSKPAYGASVGQWTSPPGVWLDGQVHMSLVGQQPLPVPTPSPLKNQRIFTTPTAARGSDKVVEIIEVEDDGSDEESDGFAPPQTPTPASRKRQTENAARMRAMASSPPLIRTPTRAGFRNRITNHSSMAQKSSGGEAKRAMIDPQTPRKGTPTKPTMPGDDSLDYSDSEFDSDMERALVALADHSECKARRYSEKKSKVSETTDKTNYIDDGETTVMMLDETDASRRNLIVPVSTQCSFRNADASKTLSCRGTSQQLRAASKQEAAADAAATTVKSGARTPPSFTLFAGRYVEGAQAVSFVSSVSSSQPRSQTASSQTLSEDSQSTIPTTTPSSSFYSDAGIFSKKAGGGSDDNSDPFMSPVHKRTHPWEDAEKQSDASHFSRGWSMSDIRYPISAEAAPEPAAKGMQQEYSIAQPRFWAADGRITVVKDENGGQALGQASQPKDHNVTLAVLQLLADQPVEPRVRQKIRSLLNGVFDDT